MFCSKCGKEMTNDENFCKYCGAPQIGTTVKEKKTMPRAAIVIVVIVAVSLISVIIGISAVSSASSLSGTWEYKVDRYNDSGFDYTIEINPDGTCIIYEYGRIPYSATYTRNSDGSYVTSSLLTSSIYGSWVIRKDGSDLLISGSGLYDNTRFTKVK